MNSKRIKPLFDNVASARAHASAITAEARAQRRAFSLPKPSIEIVTYSREVQRMLSKVGDDERAITIGDRFESMTASVVSAAIGSNGRVAFQIEINTFEFGAREPTKRRRKATAPK